MGLSYGFEFIVPRSGVRRLLVALAEHLCDEDRQRLSDALAQEPPGGSRGGDDHDHIPAAPIARGVSEDKAWTRFWIADNSYCFSFLFSPDDAAVAAYDRESRLRENGMARVGCVYTSLAVGERHVVLHASAATSDISRLFQASAAVQETFRAIAERARASAVFFNVEDDEWTLVWPDRRQCPRPDDEEFDYYEFDVDPEAIDLYAVEALRLAGVGNP